MENQQTSSKSIMLNFGLILALTSILVNIANFAFGDIYEPHWIIQVIGILLSVVFIYMGLKKFKDGNNGFLTLGEALKIGLGISLISGIVFLVYYYIFVNFIEPDYFVNLGKFQEATMLEKYPNMSDQDMENAIAMAKKFSGFGMVSAIIMIMSLFFGFIVALIEGLILKNTPEED